MVILKRGNSGISLDKINATCEDLSIYIVPKREV